MDRKHLVMLAVALIVCCTIILVRANSAQATRDRSRVQWEYSVMQSRNAFAERGPVGKIDEVDRLGLQGWELVSVFEVKGIWTYWFKRPR